MRHCYLAYSCGLLFFLCFTIFAKAQERGIVLDKSTETPLTGVNIYLTNKNFGTVTDKNGMFYFQNFSHLQENDTLYFSYVGYDTQKITYQHLKENQYQILLSPNPQLLKEVTVHSDLLSLKRYIDYTKLASLPVQLRAFGTCLIGNRIYVIGGDSSFEEKLKAESRYNTFCWYKYRGNMYVYDIPTDKWQLSTQKFKERANHSVLYDSGKIYILGGKRLAKNKKVEYLEDCIEVYDTLTQKTWKDYANPHQAVNFASCIYHHNLLVMGGSTRIKINKEKIYSNKVHALDLKTGYWYELEDMPQAQEAKGILVGDHIYLIGGYQTTALKEIQSYHITTGTWQTEGELLYAAARPALAYHENIIYIFEGDKIQTYNVKTKEIKNFQIHLSLKNSELFCINNKLYILGGAETSETLTLPSQYLYSIDLQEFEITAQSDRD